MRKCCSARSLPCRLASVPRAAAPREELKRRHGRRHRSPWPSTGRDSSLVGFQAMPKPALQPPSWSQRWNNISEIRRYEVNRGGAGAVQRTRRPGSSAKPGRRRPASTAPTATWRWCQWTKTDAAPASVERRRRIAPRSSRRASSTWRWAPKMAVTAEPILRRRRRKVRSIHVHADRRRRMSARWPSAMIHAVRSETHFGEAGGACGYPL